MMKFILAFLIITGLGVSVWDYRSWRHEETKNFGQGPVGAAPLELTRVYQNKTAGFRVRYPDGWEIKENFKFKILNFKVRYRVVEMGPVKMSVEKKNANMPDITNDEVKKIGKLAREREYIGLGQGTAVILTWVGNGHFFQRAMVEHREQIVVLDLEAPMDTQVQVLERTFTEMVRGLTLV